MTRILAAVQKTTMHDGGVDLPQIYFAHSILGDQSGHDAGRQLLQQLYTAHVGGAMPPISTTALGKPYFIDSPWHFSISHTPHHAFCVLSDAPVGVDAEEISRQVNPKLAEKILSAGELSQYLAADDPNQALLTFWVLKEAAGKCSGRGVGFHPRHTDFARTDSRVFAHSGCLVAVICQEK